MNKENKLDIHEFAYTLKKTVPAIRHLIFKGTRFGKLPAEQDSDKMWYIDREQLYIYRFAEAGYHKCSKVLHYKDGEGLVECVECSLGKSCPRVDETGHWNGKQ